MLWRKNFIVSTCISEVIEELIELLNNNEPAVEDNSKLNEISIPVYLANINDNTILYLYIDLLQAHDTGRKMIIVISMCINIQFYNKRTIL